MTASFSGTHAPTDNLLGQHRRNPSGAVERWRSARPFASLTHSERAGYLRDYGMHGRAAECRIGADAFDVRADIEVGDAFETTAQLLRGLIGSLEVLVTSPDVPAIHRDAIHACLFLARQSVGTFAVIGAAIFAVDVVSTGFGGD